MDKPIVGKDWSRHDIDGVERRLQFHCRCPYCFANCELTYRTYAGGDQEIRCINCNSVWNDVRPENRETTPMDMFFRWNSELKTITKRAYDTGWVDGNNEGYNNGLDDAQVLALNDGRLPEKEVY